MSASRLSPLGIGLLCFAGAAAAHHSRALYDMTREVVFDGTVTKLEWMNPHISMTVQTKGADGAPLLHEIEVMSVSEARNLGLDKDASAPGTHVVVRAHPGRNAGSRAVGLDVKTNDGKSMPLNTDAGYAAVAATTLQAQGLAGRWAPSVTDFTGTFPAMMKWPFTDAARAETQTAMTASGAVLGICADYPPPLLSIFPDLREIKIGSSTVEIRFEAQGQNLLRVVHLDQSAHPKDVAPSLLGHSIGRWEKNTLVIDTVAFAPHPVGVWIRVPSGPGKHLVEKLSLTEDRRHLNYDVTLEDPASLTAPAHLASVWDYRPDLAPSGVPCDPAAARKLLQP